MALTHQSGLILLTVMAELAFAFRQDSVGTASQLCSFITITSFTLSVKSQFSCPPLTLANY